MAKTKAEVLEMAEDLWDIREREKPRLDLIFSYLRDDPNDRRLGGVPDGAPDEVRRLARISRVNLMKYIVSARVQNMYVDGFQTPTSGDNLAQWTTWQRNGMDARQIGVHRSGLGFGASYGMGLPGASDAMTIRGASPRDMTVAYGDDDDWPYAALAKTRSGWRVVDDEAVYRLRGADGQFEIVTGGEGDPHGMTYDGEAVCPVVVYRDTIDFDDPVRGIVEPHIALQDQINVISFGLQVALHYGAFKQRWVIGWLADTEEQKLKAEASKLWTFEDAPTDVQVGEFSQVDPRGSIEAREASIRHLATVSQTPVHELAGQFINLSAEALEAARASHQAAIDENRTVCGESHERLLNLVGERMGIEPDPSASVMWRDTRVRSLTEAATAYGLLVEKLGVPPRELWRRIPGIPQHEYEKWIETAGPPVDPMAALAGVLDRQAAPA